ncbi:MAG: choice-of-anchor B family protein [Flavobacteriaceae bacterium]|jgi:choice-of-anchor B domain-containing protein
MRILTTISIFLMSLASAAQPCSGGMSGGYPCEGYDLLSHFPLSTFDATRANDSWGWTDPQGGAEYVLVGLNNGTAFVDVSDPVNPIYLGKLPTHTSSSTWRDIKVYNNYAFVVSEANGHGMQVFDLTRLRNVSSPPATFTEDAHFGSFGSAHNIVINEATGYAYAVGANTYSGGPHFVNIQDPLNPLDEGGYSGSGYTHDAQVVVYNGPDPDHQGKELYFGNNEDRAVIVDITDKANPQLISDFSYSNVDYTHQGWLTEDQRYFIIGDELDELGFGFNTRSIVADYTDLDNPVFHDEYFANNPSIDHNGYVVGNKYYLSSYTAGMRVIDISNIGTPGSLNEIGFFDSYPSNDNTSFDGVWNVYPFFSSGNININDINNGFFMVRASVSGTDTTPPVAVCAPYTAVLDTAGNVTITGSNVDGGSSDNSGFYSTTVSPNIFSCSDVGGPITVTLTVSDQAGNTATCTSEVTVIDNTPPSIQCPGDMTDTPEAGATFYTVPNFLAMGVTAADNCEVVSLTQTPPAGAQLVLGTYTMEFEATDPSGNTNSCSFVLTVEELGLDDYFTQGLSMFPNPAREMVQISSNHGLIESIELFSISGKVVDVPMTVDQAGASLNVSALPSGMYFVSINHGSTKKLIVR